MKRLAQGIWLLLVPLLATAQTAQTTATQAVLSYTVTSGVPCSIEVSTSPTYSPVVYAVDGNKFNGANSDGLTNVGARQFVVGQKWVGTEDTKVPASITVPPGRASRGTGGIAENLVTVTGVRHPFVYGDNITITDAGGDAYSLPWAKVWKVNSWTSFAYEVVSKAVDTNAQPLTITRANRYSLALQTNTTYYYRIGNLIISGMAKCVSSPLTGTFTTMNIPNGTTWAEGPVTDNNGSELFPSIPESRPGTVIDPLTGVAVSRMSLRADAGTLANGWSSSFYRVCSITTSPNGYYHCHTAMGNYPNSAIYAIKPGSPIKWTGFGTYSYTDSHGATYHGITGGDSSTSSTSDANTWYGLAQTNGAYTPNKNVLVKYQFSGNDSVDAAAGYSWNASATALTPDPSNTLDDQLAAFDATFMPGHFHSCALVESFIDILQGYCRSANQGSPAWLWTFRISTNRLISLTPAYANRQCRWCGTHGTTVTMSQKWVDFSQGMMNGPQEGEWQLSLVNAIGTTDTSMSVTAPRWRANTALTNSETTHVGFAITDSNGNLEIATPATQIGTTGATAPIWNTSRNGATNDGTVVWTNYGRTLNPNEPQNVFPRNDLSNGTGYWTYLMPVAGGSGGRLNGDVFTFADGTFECVRVLTVGSSGQWSVVQRAVYYPGSLYCASSTAKAHAAGARLLAVCEPEETLGATNYFWDFLDDPHGHDTTNTYFVRFSQHGGHGYAREPAPASWNSGQLFFWHNPWISTDFAQHPEMQLAMDVPFAGYTTSTAGAAHNDYTNWDFENATFKGSAITTNVMYGGGGTTGYGTFAKVIGTTSIYKYIWPTLSAGPATSKLPWNSLSGPNTIKDISAPRSALIDGDSTPASCFVVVASECWTGSTPGEAYANLPVVDALSCSPGGENSSFTGHDWCFFNQSTRGDTLLQADLAMANSLGTDPNGIRISGYGLSRNLVRTMAGGLKTQNNNPHVIPDGSGFIFQSCVADPTIIYDFGSHTHGANNTGDFYGCQIFYAQIPPQPPGDGLDRTNYLTVPITIGSGGSNPNYACLEYGYEENEPARAVTRPPSIHYYATQYQATSYWGRAGAPVYSASSCTHLSLNAAANLSIGVPQRVMYYNILYFNSRGSQVGSSGLQVVAVDPAAQVTVTATSSISPGTETTTRHPLNSKKPAKE